MGIWKMLSMASLGDCYKWQGMGKSADTLKTLFTLTHLLFTHTLFAMVDFTEIKGLEMLVATDKKR